MICSEREASGGHPVNCWGLQQPVEQRGKCDELTHCGDSLCEAPPQWSPRCVNFPKPWFLCGDFMWFWDTVMILTHFCIKRFKFCGSSVTKSTPKPSIDHVWPCHDACWVMAQLNLNTSQGLDCADRAWPAESDRPRKRLAAAWPRNSDSLRHQGSYWDTPQDSSSPLGEKPMVYGSPFEFPLYNLYILYFGRGRPSYKWFRYRHFVVTMSLLNRAFSNRAPKRQVVHFEVFILYCKSFEVPIHFIRPSSLCFWGFL